MQLGRVRRVRCNSGRASSARSKRAGAVSRRRRHEHGATSSVIPKFTTRGELFIYILLYKSILFCPLYTKSGHLVLSCILYSVV